MNTVILNIPDEQMQKLEYFAQQHGVNISTAIKELISYIPDHSEPENSCNVTEDPFYSIKSHETDDIFPVPFKREYARKLGTAKGKVVIKDGFKEIPKEFQEYVS